MTPIVKKSNSASDDKLELVDALQQLGVAYHFKDEINCVLTNIHESMGSAMPDDLYEVSLLFRLLRMHGFSVQEGIFFCIFVFLRQDSVVNYHVYFTLIISDSTLNELSGLKGGRMPLIVLIETILEHINLLLVMGII